MVADSDPLAIAVKGVTPTIKEVTLPDGKDTVQVDGTTTVEGIQVKAASVKGTDITNGVTWSVEPTGKGVTIDENGMITVGPKAEAVEGGYKIRAAAKSGSSQGEAKSATLTVTRATVVLDHVTLDKTTVNVTGGESAAQIVTPKAIDQFDSEMTDGVSWSVSGPDTSNVTATNNTISVGAKAKEGTYTVTGTQGSDASAKTATKDFTVVRAAAAAEKVEISGGKTEFTVPANNTNDTATFTATVTDQYDAVMTNPSVTWKISPEVTGVSVAGGTVTVSSAAKDTILNTTGTKFTVTAECGGKSATQEITVKRATATATSIAIYKEGSETPITTDTAVIPPQSVTEANTYKYVGKVLDQYGTAMTEKTVTLATDGTVPNGVTFATDTLSVTKEAAKGTTVTIKATGESKEATLVITLVDVDVKWNDHVTVKSSMTYGDTNASAVTIPTGEVEAAEVNGAKLKGTFAVKDASQTQAAGNQTVTVEFTITSEDANYKGVKITKDYSVTIGKKPITATVTPVTIDYGDAIPTTYSYTFAGLVGQDTIDLSSSLEAKEIGAGNVGSYSVGLKDGFTNANYEVTVANNTALTIDRATIQSITTPAPTPVEILANDTTNNASESSLRTYAQLPEKVSVSYGDSKAADLPITWAMSPAFDVKGKVYTFTGTVDTFDSNFNATTEKLTVTLTVTPVKGTASITPTASTKAFAKVTGASQWSDLSMPTTVAVSYDNSVTDGPYSVTDWSPNLASLKAQATGTADKTVKLTPVVTYPEWATITNTPEFTMTLTPKYPVTVTVVAPSDITFGETLAAPTASQTAMENGTDNTAGVSYTYTYTGVDGTTYGPSTEAPRNAGKYQVVATLNSATHSGTSESATFTISQKDISGATVTLDLPEGGYTYDKTAKTPAATVKDGETALVEGTDYTVEYTNNTNAGTATVTATGKGNYSGTATANFTIEKASITEMVPTVSGSGEAGTVLTASLDGVAPEELTWEWYVGDTPQTETTAAYVVKPADSNKDITAKAVGKGSGEGVGNYTGTTTASSNAINVPKVMITGTVTVSLTGDTNSDGIINEGDTVTATASVVPAGIDLTYSWNNGEAGASNTYVVQASDTEITVTVKPGADFDGTLTSAPVVVGKSVLTGTVRIAGATTVGGTLTATVSASPAADTDYTIIWLRDGVAISGATGTTYTVTADDLGKTITAKVTAAGETYTGELVSAGTDIPATVPDAPSVTATPGDGQVTVTWNTPAANGAPVTGYTVTAFSVTAAVAGGGSVTLPVGTNIYTFTGLTNGTAYTFSVVATNSIGNSAPDTATATPTAPTPVDPKPEQPPYIPPVIVDPGTGGTGSSGSGSGSGSGTTTPDKDVTENPDGSTVTVETQPDGTVVTTTVDSEGNTATKLENPDGSSTTTIQNVDGTTALVNTDASGKTSAVVDLSNEAVSSAQNTGAAVVLPIENVTATRDAETAPTVVVNTESEQPVKVEIPVSNAGTGTVAVLVKADGTEEIIKTTVPTAGGIAVKLNSGDAVKIVDNTKAFSDTVNHWGGDAVTFVSSRELFNGTGGTAFSPDANMTRGMLMTVLARFESVDTTGGATWYEKGVAWAVTQGLSDGTNPNGEITREQLATIIYRFAQSKGVDTAVSRGDLSRFPDAGKVSGWAEEAMSWAVAEGIISGVGGATLEPGGNATRAQVATIIMRFAEKFA